MALSLSSHRDEIVRPAPRRGSGRVEPPASAGRAARLDVRGVCWGPGRRGPLVLHPVDFALAPGRVLGVVGPNGAGKSTLLRALYRFQSPRAGTVRLDGADLWSMAPRAAARRVAAVLQEQPGDFALTVREIAALGRLPHHDGLARAGARDAEIVEAALERLDLAPFAGRRVDTLSGGERQRVMVARALAQEPGLLILDEPTNHLDIRHQLEILALIRDLDLTIIASLHDLNMAAGACDEVLLLDRGRPQGFGPPASVLDEAAVAAAFRVSVRRERLAPSGAAHMSFSLPQDVPEIERTA